MTNRERLPRLILVEANVLSRPVDTALIEKYSRSGNTEPLLFRPIRTAVAAYENWLHAPVDHAQAVSSLGRLLEQPPSDFDNRTYVDRAFQKLDAEDPTQTVTSNVDRIERLSRAIEQRGGRLLLFELPYAPQLEDARSVEITRTIVHSRFADPDRWLRFDSAGTELRWADGVHLDERSAVIVSRSIDTALSSYLGRKRGR